MAREWIIENTWNCPHCKKLNRGRDMSCHGCGAHKDAKVQDNIGNPDEVVTDREMLRQARAGRNWVCDYCNGQVRNPHGECKNCGGPKTSAAKSSIASTEVVQKTEYGTITRINFTEEARDGLSTDGNLIVEGGSVTIKNAEVEGDIVARATGDLPEARVVDGDAWTPKRKWKWPTWRRIQRPTKLQLTLALIPAAAVLLTWGIIWLATPRELDARVQSISWEHTEMLRERETRHAAEWGRPWGGKDHYNESAFNVSCHRKYYGEERCNPHNCRPHSVSYSCNCSSYSCNCRTSCSSNGNGYSTCRESCSTCQRCSTCSRTEYDTCYDSCAVYKDWCNYDYYEWPIRKTQKHSGRTHAVSWPNLPTVGNQRVQKVREYQVVFRSEDETFTYEPDELTTFQKFFVGDLWHLKVGRVTGRPDPVKKLQ